MEGGEFRIGNFVLRIDEGNIEPVDIPETIYEVGHYSLVTQSNQHEYDIEKFKGILLTEDILFKFGFEKLTIGWYVLNPLSFYYTPQGYEFTNLKIDKKFKYVHEMQNLYFVLTGNELNLK